MGTESSPNIPGPVACHNCVGACCRSDTLLTLSDDELRNNQENMRLECITPALSMDQYVSLPMIEINDEGQRVIKPRRLKIIGGYGLYMLEVDCGNLTPDFKCRIYDDPKKPEICSVTKVGSQNCLTARGEHADEIIARQANHLEMLEEAV